MLVKLICPQCGAKMDIDDSREHIFCSFCGAKIENIAQKIDISGTVTHIIDRSNDPNLYISYASTDCSVGMVTRIVSTGQKNTYLNGQTATFHLPKGPQKIVLKIGKRNYDRNIFILEDNSPVRINASYNGRAHIDIDQPPYYDTTAGKMMDTSTPTIKPMSGLAIVAFILSFFYFLSPVGLGFGIYDIVKGSKEKRHGLSIAAIIIGGIMTLVLLLGLFGLGNQEGNKLDQPAADSAVTAEVIPDSTISSVDSSFEHKETITQNSTMESSVESVHDDETVTADELINAVREAINGQLGEDEEVIDITFNKGKLTITVDLTKAEPMFGYEMLALARIDSLGDGILHMDTKYKNTWTELTLNFINVGCVTLTKDDIRNGYFDGYDEKWIKY